MYTRLVQNVIAVAKFDSAGFVIGGGGGGGGDGVQPGLAHLVLTSHIHPFQTVARIKLMLIQPFPEEVISQAYKNVDVGKLGHN